jgi:uncharacterized protein YlbG (UPF0298 family)
MGEKDKSYKLLFSHAQMVKELLRDFVKEDWVKKLDFSTLKKYNNSFVDESLKEPWARPKIRVSDEPLLSG